MPIYEYVCQDCHERFESIRAMKDADQPITCSACHGFHTKRVMSLFCAHSDGKDITHTQASGCAGCAGGSCASCNH